MGVEARPSGGPETGKDHVMFPGAHAHVYRNEAGEPTGWDYPSVDEPSDLDPYDQADALDDEYVEHVEADALDAIAAVMDGREWSADTLDEIADLVRTTGRQIRDVADVEVDR